MTWPPFSRGARSKQDTGINEASEAKTPFSQKVRGSLNVVQREPDQLDQPGTSRTSRDQPGPAWNQPGPSAAPRRCQSRISADVGLNPDENLNYPPAFSLNVRDRIRTEAEDGNQEEHAQDSPAASCAARVKVSLVRGEKALSSRKFMNGGKRKISKSKGRKAKAAASLHDSLLQRGVNALKLRPGVQQQPFSLFLS